MKLQCTLLLLLFSILLVVSADQDYTQWHLPEGAKARLGKGYVRDVVYSPDGNSIAVASSIGIWLYDAQTYQEVFLLTGHRSGVNSVSFSSDGQTLASGGGFLDQTIRLWDVSTGEQKHKHRFIGHRGDVLSVSFSPDGQTLASAGHDIRLWDVSIGKLKHELKGHKRMVYSVSFSPDGQTLASGSDDGTVLLWDLTALIQNK